jgi:hypothetical protein
VSRVWASQDLVWRGEVLLPYGRKHPSVSIVRDVTYPNMWRVRLPDGLLTDMVNRARARDAARSILRRILQREETSLEESPVSFAGETLVGSHP